jgi:hypothetical protein
VRPGDPLVEFFTRSCGKPTTVLIAAGRQDDRRRGRWAGGSFWPAMMPLLLAIRAAGVGMPVQ